MKTAIFDFELPEELIALRPAEPRDSARMLVVRPDNDPATFADRTVSELPAELRPGDVLVFNDTRVIPAYLEGVRLRNGQQSRVTFNLVKRLGDLNWQAFARPAKRLEAGDRVRFGAEAKTCLAGELMGTITAKADGGLVDIAFDLAGPALDDALAVLGEMPLPPYIALRRPADEADQSTYQTIYARRDGAVAAPTAGFHFTPELLQRLAEHGVESAFLTLHIGAGTFLPVKVDDTSQHQMHSEWGEIDAEVADKLNAARARGGRIVSVGTTSLRVLETAARPDGRLAAFRGETDIFITPGYRFKAVDILLTNFHLPRSTLFMLVSAFSGLDTMHYAYAHAIENSYRFYSYGDACLLHRTNEAPAALVGQND